MNRRIFLKALAAMTGASIIPQRFSSPFFKQANAAVDYSAITVDNVPDVLPQVINIFLYGGPSELAGNLSNIADIQANSQMSYLDFFPGLTTPQSSGGNVTNRGFWGSEGGLGVDGDAGGDDMEWLVQNGHMSVYRTMMSRQNTSRAHRENILMSQKGSLDIDFSAGFAFKLGAMIAQHRDKYEGLTSLADGRTVTTLEELVMPFISIGDGDTRVFDKDGAAVPLLFNGISVDTGLGNPFERSEINGITDSTSLDAIVEQQMTNDTRDFNEVEEAFKQRAILESQMSDFSTVFDTQVVPGGGYPDTRIGRQVRAAVTMAIENPSALFITLGGALGGWDDHNNGVDEYPNRMREVFEALRIAKLHIDDRHNNGPAIVSNMTRRTDNIIINVFGDFGRRVNLNTSLGWNHGNNQNLYTLGGGMAGLRTAGQNDGLGNIVGQTVRVGQSNQDSQYTEPMQGSYEFEPMAVASTIFKYFGANYQATVDANGHDPMTSLLDSSTGDVLYAGTPPIVEEPGENGAT